MSSSKKDMLPLLRKLKEQGFTVEITKKCHYKVTAPDGRKTHMPYTPGDHRSVKNVRSQLKRIGFVP